MMIAIATLLVMVLGGLLLLWVWKDGHAAGKVEGIQLGVAQAQLETSRDRLFLANTRTPEVRVEHNYYGTVRQLPVPQRDERGRYRGTQEDPTTR